MQRLAVGPGVAQRRQLALQGLDLIAALALLQHAIGHRRLLCTACGLRGLGALRVDLAAQGDAVVEHVT